MRDQHNESLNDDLAREIEQALAVEPSPEFQARVRQRVAQEPPVTEAAFGWWRPAMWPAAAIITTVGITIAGWHFGPFSSMGDERASVEQPRIQDQPGSKQQPVQSVASAMTQQINPKQAAVPSTTQKTTGRSGNRSRQSLPAMRTLDWLAPVIVAEDEIAGMRALIADAQAGRFESFVVTDEPVATVVSAPPPSAVVAERPTSETASAFPSDDTDAELARTSLGPDMPQARPPQIASALSVRPLIIEPLTIKPVVQSLPDETLEGVAE